MFKHKVYPSILSADFGHLAQEAKRCEQAKADAIHVDIMDGHFVPNLSLSTKSLAALRKAVPSVFLDVHIMVYHPFDYIEGLVAAGANQITFHLEATEEVEETLKYIRTCKVKAGLAICPETSSSLLIKYLEQCDHILLMTVNPGAAGQAFMPEVLDKIEELRGICQRLRIGKGGKVFEEGKSFEPLDIGVDGGIDLETGKQCLEKGANVLISGSYLFRGDLNQNVAAMKAL